MPFLINQQKKTSISYATTADKNYFKNSHQLALHSKSQTLFCSRDIYLFVLVRKTFHKYIQCQTVAGPIRDFRALHFNFIRMIFQTCQAKLNIWKNSSNEIKTQCFKIFEFDGSNNCLPLILNDENRDISIRMPIANEVSVLMYTKLNPYQLVQQN